MKDAQFKALLADAIKHLNELSDNKGAEYTETHDRLENFKIGSQMSGLTPKHYAWTLMTKHLVSVRQHNIGQHPLTQDQLREKYGDIRLYTVLLEGMEKFA